MRTRSHPIDGVVAEALAAVEPAIKDRLMRRLIGLSPGTAKIGEVFDALAIDKIVPVSVEPETPLQIKIGGEGNLVASQAVVGKVTVCSHGLFTYTPINGYRGPDQFAVKDSDGKVTLIRIAIR